MKARRRDVRRRAAEQHLQKMTAEAQTTIPQRNGSDDEKRRSAVQQESLQENQVAAEMQLGMQQAQQTLLERSG
jgi:hypothetical protein